MKCWILLMTVAGLGSLTAACGAEPATAETPTAEIACTLPKEDLGRIGIERQLVLNLSLAKGGNLKSMRETMAAPDPETFRKLGAVFEGFVAAGMPSSPTFDAPDVVARDLLKTADLLETALAAGENPADPAWAELAAFYDQKFFVRHNSAVNYYLSEAGCI